MKTHSRALRAFLLAGVSTLGLSGTAQAVVPRDEQAATTAVTFPSIPSTPTGTPTTVNVAAGVLADGNNTLPYVGYSVTDLTTLGQAGFIGQCSGALINPRFFLTAAHCYNSNGTVADTTYGVGGLHRHAVSFRPLPLANNSLVNWLLGTPLVNVTSNGFTDVASVRYAPGNITFQQADIAVVTLSTPVTGVGSTPLLMSPLDSSRDAILAGFGLTGTGSTGATISSRVRRIGQNNVGALASIDDLCVQVFGAPAGCFGARPQDLYWADFDSRTTAPGVRANAFDFDVLPGATRPNEAITAPGDSGGSVFVNINGTQVSLGPLSGGFRFFGASQPFSSYGTTSFWQPAFLYANWIASVNPERYYVAKAGNFSWTSGAAWDEFLDPNFLILSGGNLVNGLPAVDAGIGVSPNLGAFNDGSIAPADAIGSASFAPAIDIADAGMLGAPSSSPDATGGFDVAPMPAIEPTPPGLGGPLLEPQAANPPNTPTAPRPVGTFALTPVAVFPDNINGTNLINGRYFDVTLSRAGTVTLSGLSPTIDRLTITGASSGLTIDAGNTLTSLISPELWAGNLTVNGGLTSALNIWQLGGKLQGTGTLTAGAGGGVFALGGTIAPGNSIGTMNIVGPYAQGPAGVLEIELTNGSSDVLAIAGNALLDGTVQFKPFGPNPLVGQSYDFLTTTGTRVGIFGGIQDLLPGTLFPIVTYGSNFARVTIGDLCSFASGPVDLPICNVLSDPGVQGDPDMIPAIGGLQALASTPGALSEAMKALNPTRAHAQTMVGMQAGDLLRNQLGRRSHDLLGGSTRSGDVAMRDMAARQLASADPSGETLAAAAVAALEANDTAGGHNIKLANGNSLFFAADFGTGETDQPGGIGKDKADVSVLTAGFDHVEGNYAFGVAASFFDSEVGQDYGLGGSTESDGLAFSGFANMALGGFYADAYVSGAWHDFDTLRTLMIGPFTSALAEGSTDARQWQAGLTAGYRLHADDTIKVGAVGGLYFIDMSIDGYTETGAGPFSAVIPTRSINSLRSQLGGEVAARVSSDDTFVPLLRLVWNHEFEDEALLFRSAFVGAPAVTFATPGPTLGTDWATVGLGVTGRLKNGMSYYVRYQHDLGREGQENQEVSGAMRFAF